PGSSEHWSRRQSRRLSKVVYPPKGWLRPPSDPFAQTERFRVQSCLHHLCLWGVAFAHHLLVQFPDACLRQGFYKDNPIRDAVVGNNALFDKALKMGPDLLFADLMAGLYNQEPERPLDPFWIRRADYGRFSHARVPEDQVLKL